MMYLPALTNLYHQLEIFLDNIWLKVVDTFQYFGITLNLLCSLDDKITNPHLKSYSEVRVWTDIKDSTKILVYRADVLSCVLYSCNIPKIRALQKFHQRYLTTLYVIFKFIGCQKHGTKKFLIWPPHPTLKRKSISTGDF